MAVAQPNPKILASTLALALMLFMCSLYVRETLRSWKHEKVPHAESPCETTKNADNAHEDKEPYMKNSQVVYNPPKRPRGHGNPKRNAASDDGAAPGCKEPRILPRWLRGLTIIHES